MLDPFIEAAKATSLSALNTGDKQVNNKSYSPQRGSSTTTAANFDSCPGVAASTKAATSAITGVMNHHYLKL